MLHMISHLSHRLLNARSVAILTALTFAFTTLGCYNHYYLEREAFAELQRPDEIPKVIKAKDGTEVVVDRDTLLVVTSTGGREYEVSPFNFKLTESQLVASDRDTLLMTNELNDYEVRHFSTAKTIPWIVGGVAVVAGIIVGTVILAGQSTDFSN